jgi:hypothetical protein
MLGRDATLLLEMCTIDAHNASVTCPKSPFVSCPSLRKDSLSEGQNMESKGFSGATPAIDALDASAMLTILTIFVNLWELGVDA